MVEVKCYVPGLSLMNLCINNFGANISPRKSQPKSLTWVRRGRSGEPSKGSVWNNFNLVLYLLSLKKNRGDTWKRKI